MLPISQSLVDGNILGCLQRLKTVFTHSWYQILVLHCRLYSPYSLFTQSFYTFVTHYRKFFSCCCPLHSHGRHSLSYHTLKFLNLSFKRFSKYFSLANFFVWEIDVPLCPCAPFKHPVVQLQL